METSLREQLLNDYKTAAQLQYESDILFPETKVIPKKQAGLFENNYELLNDYVSFDPKHDLFKIYVQGRAIEFSGSEFDWIFRALREIGSYTLKYWVIFYDKNKELKRTEVIFGDKVKPYLVKPTAEKELLYWTLDEENEMRYNFDTPIVGNLYLFAKWRYI